MFRNARYTTAIFLTLVGAGSAYAQSGNNILGGMTGILQGYQQAQQQNQQIDILQQQQQQYQEQQRQASIAATDRRLLPLSPSGGISPETQQLIFSALSEALELDSGYSERRWTNQSKGSSGVVAVAPSFQNKQGNDCRNFQLELTDSQGVSHSLSGVACREQGGWRWLSGIN